MTSRVTAEGLEIQRWDEEGDPDTDFVRIVPDLTQVSRTKRHLCLERPAHCKSVVVAANEGPLVQLAKSHPDSEFNAAIELLHAGQRGERRDFDSDLPTVIDVGGFDPIEAGVTGRLLALPILSEMVNSSECSCDAPAVCPRKRTWAQLASESVRERVDEVLRTAASRGHAVLLRELWDLVADMATGGSCADSPPSSPWFYRIFYGDSRLTRRLRSSLDPDLLVFPRAEARLWYGDWFAPELNLATGLSLLPTGTVGTMTSDEFSWLRAQLFFLTEDSSVGELLRDQYDLLLLDAVEQGRTVEVVHALNSYMTYGSLRPSGTTLYLWTDLGVERRTDRPRVQASLGTVRDSTLRLGYSQAVLNHPDDMEARGSRRYLIHVDSGTSFELTAEAIALIRSGRSYRTADRAHTDLEWSIGQFYSGVGSHIRTSDRLEVAHIDFESMSGEHRVYNVSASSLLIEPVED